MEFLSIPKLIVRLVCRRIDRRIYGLKERRGAWSNVITARSFLHRFPTVHVAKTQRRDCGCARASLARF